MGTSRILIVDDEPDMLESCSRILSRHGYACTTAGDARSALAVLERTCEPDGAGRPGAAGIFFGEWWPVWTARIDANANGTPAAVTDST